MSTSCPHPTPSSPNSPSCYFTPFSLPFNLPQPIGKGSWDPHLPPPTQLMLTYHTDWSIANDSDTARAASLQVLLHIRYAGLLPPFTFCLKELFVGSGQVCGFVSFAISKWAVGGQSMKACEISIFRSAIAMKVHSN